MAAPDPGNLAGVLEMARVAEMEDFDRARPLWTVTLIDGLEDGGAAVLCKFHHSLTDGVGGVQIGMTLFDLSELPSRARAAAGSAEGAPAAVVERIPRRVRLRRGTRRNGDGGAITSAPKLIYHSIRRPVATVESATATAASIYRTVRPVNRTGSPLMKNRTLTRRLGVHQVPMPQLREAAHRCGGALNDAFVAGLAGGLRRYHEKHGVSVGDLHLTMPISLRAEGDEMGGNRITLMRFDVPVGVVDPAARISAINEQTGKVRR